MKAGTVISCEACGAAQMKTTKDLMPGSQMKDAGFVSMGFDMDGMRAGCYKCGEKFVRPNALTGRTHIHTEENGWVPLSKEAPIESPKDPDAD